MFVLQEKNREYSLMYSASGKVPYTDLELVMRLSQELAGYFYLNRTKYNMGYTGESRPKFRIRACSSLVERRVDIA